VKQLPRALMRYGLSGSVLLCATAAVGQDPFAELASETRPLATRWQSDYSGAAQLGLGYVSNDNTMFGQYNGLSDEGATLIGNLQWNSFRNGASYWQANVQDLGLDTREGELVWGLTERFEVSAGFDSQLQVRNDSGKTPFRGGSNLSLPEQWTSGLTTSDFDDLNDSLRSFDRELERKRYWLGATASLNDQWTLESELRYENKEGTADTAGAIYIDAASGDSALLPQTVDYSTTEFDLGLIYSADSLHLDGRLSYSDFDNNDDLLIWQNPYSSFSPRVRYPQGNGGMSLAPDNEQLSGRLSGYLLINATARLQFDGSYSVASQDQHFADYSVNPQLEVSEPVPRTSLDGEVVTSTFNATLKLRPMPRMNLDAKLKIRERDYENPRNGYRYIRGDGSDQPRSALTVYNTSHDYLSQIVGFETGFRLPWRSRLTFDYEFEEVERRNAAVEETEESRGTLGYRIRLLPSLRAKAEVTLANRSADTYNWDQSYYALLDTELINATPDNQRYINHPELSQYYLSNRERWETKLNLQYTPASRWDFNTTLNWREDDFDKSRLGLTKARWRAVHLAANYAASQDTVISLYGGVDEYHNEQSSRAFRGGQEKNAFAIYPPLPQASDPTRNWGTESDDTSISLGANASWQLRKDISLELDYTFVSTNAEQTFSTNGASDLNPENFPDNETSQHQLSAAGTWDMRENLSLRLDYQYFRFDWDDWALQDVAANTIDKVLTFGERNPNETIHYMGASVIYRWQ